jgi:hypothetical protein
MLPDAWGTSLMNYCASSVAHRSAIAVLAGMQRVAGAVVGRSGVKVWLSQESGGGRASAAVKQQEGKG